MSPTTLQSKRRLEIAEARIRNAAVAASLHAAFFLFLLFLAGTGRVLPGPLIAGGIALALLHLALGYALTRRSRVAGGVLVASALGILLSGAVRRYGLYMDLSTLLFGYFYVQGFRGTRAWHEIVARQEREEAEPPTKPSRKKKRSGKAARRKR